MRQTQRRGGMRERVSRAAVLCLAAALAAAPGCIGPAATPKPSSETGEVRKPSPALKPIQELYDRGEYNRALLACVDLQQTSPDAPGLAELRQKVMTALTEQRVLRIARDEELAAQRLSAENIEHLALPDTYGLTRYVSGEPLATNEIDSGVATELEKPVSVHLRGANVAGLIEALSKGSGINMIADATLAPTATINVEVDHVPLRELLDYISRNCGVQFYLGRSVIWVTSPDPNRAAPLVTRVFRLRKGLQFHGGDWGAPKAPTPVKADLAIVSEKATVLATQKTQIEEALEKFVTPVPGAMTMLDRNSHTLIVRNNPDNLRIIADIVRALDVDPPQILIEARFLEIGAADLRELGLEWILNSPLVVSEKSMMVNGQMQTLPRTIVKSGNVIDYTPYRSDILGTTPLGPQGSFGQIRPGNPATDDQGLNMTYQGLLTEPMFQAVIHALEISGKGRLMSSPRVATVNNNPAKLRDGEDLMYYVEFAAQTFSVYDAYGRLYQMAALVPKDKPETAELGITLLAVPSVGADRQTISLLLTPTISELVRFENYQDTAVTNVIGTVRQVVVKLPVIARREVQTKVIVQSGETVVLGGLIRKVKQDTVHRVPFLGELPGLGALFRRTDTTEEQRNLLIFVTATVMSERGENLLVRAPAAAATPTNAPPAEVPAAPAFDPAGIPSPPDLTPPPPAPPVTPPAAPSPAPATPAPVTPAPAAVPAPAPAAVAPAPVVPAPVAPPAATPVPVAAPAPAPAPAAPKA